jgi:transcriptional regulator with XRE-family HTH domain
MEINSKEEIAKVIKGAMGEKGLSIRVLADNIGLKHPQIVRVTRGDNYNVDTLFKLLDGLDLELTIKPK